MVKVRKVFSVCMLLAMLFSGFSVSGHQLAVAQDDSLTSAGLVSGPWRIVVLQTVVGNEVTDAGLEPATQGVWAVVVVDVTNTGVTGNFDPATLQLGAVADSPLSMTDGVPGDLSLSATASQTLTPEGVSPEGTFPVRENNTTRMAIVFPLSSDPEGDEVLVLRLNEQVMRITNTVVEEFAVAELPDLVPEMQLQVADITAVVGDGKIEVAMRAGGDETIQMDGVISPDANADVRSSCYASESVTQVMNLTGGTVWIEEVPETGESLVWFNDPAAANFGLLNSHLIAGGFAGVDSNSLSPYVNWMGSVQEYAKSQSTGLWSVCKDAEGAWINQPLPTPIPTQSPEQVRAQYQWVDTRDLVIRPFEFEGEKIAVSGTVFNIMADRDGTFIQMYVQGGNYDAVSIFFYGDSRGIYEDSWITVYGTGAGTFEGTNLMGGVISQPLIIADIIDH
jgi:hypothetical protein